MFFIGTKVHFGVNPVNFANFSATNTGFLKFVKNSGTKMLYFDPISTTDSKRPMVSTLENILSIIFISKALRRINERVAANPILLPMCGIKRA